MSKIVNSMEAKVNNFQNNAKNSSIILTSESNEMDLSVKLSKIFSYNGHNVSFIKTSYGILLNATQMAKAFNKKPAEYLRLPSVNQLIKSMVGFSHLSENQIVTTMLGSPENGGGTWMFEDLAIDFARLVSYLEYKCELAGIKIVIYEESYTSKCDSLAFEKIGKHDSYLGRRKKRGLFQSSVGKIINADVNGALNIMRKVVGDSCESVCRIIDRGLLFNPVRIMNVFC